MRSLNQFVDVHKSQALNTNSSIAEILDRKHIINSDADPEILMEFEFESNVNITEIKVWSDYPESEPTRLCICTGMSNFDYARATKNKFELVYEGTVATVKIPAMELKSDTEFSVLFSENAEDADETEFSGIEFFGQVRNSLDTRGKTLNSS